MTQTLKIYNSLSREKEEFKPINPPYVGLYVCGPTVYGDPHLGHARPAITFDILFRYLKHLGFKVRYVRNITDVGHLESDGDRGEDKVAVKARLEQLEPMEVVQYYINRYHECMAQLNVLEPSIEPQASGHIIEQQELIRQIIDAGYAYERDGSVYFDIEKYNQKYQYGKLSGRNVDEMLSYTRELSGQQEKKNNFDFALWKKAAPEHIMRWSSEWSDGFPGWHLECSAMSAKYLGKSFDIHGGGMDLLFPHHECEIAQSTAAHGHEHVKYWMHNNMVTIGGQKMGKSLGNFINLEQFFTGEHELLEQAYSPMTIRFFILQAHYRSTVDFSNEALQASEKGMQRLLKAMETLEEIQASDSSTVDYKPIEKACFQALDDDLNTPIAIAQLFDAVRMINSLKEVHEKISEGDLAGLKKFMAIMCHEILGLVNESASTTEKSNEDALMQLIIDLRLKARADKDWATSDAIRDKLAEAGIVLKDGKDGTTWEKA